MLEVSEAVKIPEAKFDELCFLNVDIVTDDELPGLVVTLGEALRQMRAILLVELTGAKTSDQPWNNAELVMALESLVRSGLVIEGLPEEITRVFLDLTTETIGEDKFSLCNVSLVCESEGYYAEKELVRQSLTMQIEGQNLLLSRAREAGRNWSVDRLTKYVTKPYPPAWYDVSKRNRKYLVDFFETAQLLLFAAVMVQEALDDYRDGRPIKDFIKTYSVSN